MRIALTSLLLLISLTGCSSDGTKCSSNADCKAGEACVGGSCRRASSGRRCTDETDCDEGEFCDFFDKICRLPGEDTGVIEDSGVEEDVGTPPSDTGVTIDTGMPRDAEPFDNGVADVGPVDTWRPDTGVCVQDDECGPPAGICINDSCEAGCGINPAVCQANEVCDTNTGRCQPRVTNCANDNECIPGPPAQVCEGTQCVPGCGQTGGIVCQGPTPVCNTGTGRCEAPGSCNLDADCGDPDFICVNQACLVRCERPTASPCAPDVCNPNTGRCVAANQPLGFACEVDAQCTTGICIAVGPAAGQQFCTQPCGRTSDCPMSPIAMTCDSVIGMSVCIAETALNPPPTWTTISGGFCDQNTNTCHSGVCNLTQSNCVERCYSNARCNGFGGNCWAWEETDGMGQLLYTPICVNQGGSGPGVSCTNNTQCLSGVCNRYFNTCADICCSTADCQNGQTCGIYDVNSVTGQIIRVCRPKTPGSGALQLGATCTADSECQTEYCAPLDFANPGGPRKCSTTCCTDTDCTLIPGAGACLPWVVTLGQTSSAAYGLCRPF